MSVNLDKTLEYFKIQEHLRSEISQSIIYVKEYFCMFFSTLKDNIQPQSKSNH